MCIIRLHPGAHLHQFAGLHTTRRSCDPVRVFGKMPCHTHGKVCELNLLFLFLKTGFQGCGFSPGVDGMEPLYVELLQDGKVQHSSRPLAA